MPVCTDDDARLKAVRRDVDVFFENGKSVKTLKLLAGSLRSNGARDEVRVTGKTVQLTPSVHKDLSALKRGLEKHYGVRLTFSDVIKAFLLYGCSPLSALDEHPVILESDGCHDKVR